MRSPMAMLRHRIAAGPQVPEPPRVDGRRAKTLASLAVVGLLWPTPNRKPLTKIGRWTAISSPKPPGTSNERPCGFYSASGAGLISPAPSISAPIFFDTVGAWPVSSGADAGAVGTGAPGGRYGTAAWADHRSSKLRAWPVVSGGWVLDTSEWLLVGVWAVDVPALMRTAATVSRIDRLLMRRSFNLVLKEHL